MTLKDLPIDGPGPVSTWQAALEPLLATVAHAERVTGMVVAVARGAATAEFLVRGHAADELPLSATTLFPVASLTKLATALAVLRLAAQGHLALDDQLAHYLPAAAAAQPGVTLRGLLCHSAGLPVDLAPELAPYAIGLNWAQLATACLATGLEAAPGTRVCYSNTGYGLLALVVERVTGQPFAQALEVLVLKPLAINGYLGAEPGQPVARLGGQLGTHAGTELEPYNSAFWRGLALPWAGLLTDAAGALALVRAFAGVPAGFLPPALLAEATSDQTGGLAGGTPGFLQWPHCPWGLGPELRGSKRPHYTPGVAAATTFGHAGGSGCMAFYDPQTRVAWAMLSTRTLPGWWLRWPAIGAVLL